MKELSLFSGAGGGVLGTKLLGWEAIGYVEYNEYCQQVIAQRIEDGFLDEAPIFSDVRAFLSEGYAESYQGMVDVVTAGFPCQPFSIAGVVSKNHLGREHGFKDKTQGTLFFDVLSSSVSVNAGTRHVPERYVIDGSKSMAL